MKITLTICLLLVFFFCTRDSIKTPEDKALICTEQFVTLTIQITGEVPSSYYTIRIATSDTIKIDSYFDNYYPIVNDNIVSDLQAGDTEKFIFVAERYENPIREVYDIMSDGCHVIKVNGIESIN